MDELRLFISVAIDSQQIKKSIAEFQSQLSFRGIKLVEPDLFHFSLHFLGDTSQDLLPKLKSVLSTVKQSPFTVELSSVGVFPSFQNIKVLWVGVSTGSHELVSLKQQLDNPLKDLGFTIDSRIYTPHLTIGRVKFINPEFKSKIQKLFSDHKSEIFGSQQISTLHLMQSTLRPEGPTYTSLFSYSLQG